MANHIPQKTKKEPCERYHILTVMLNDWYKRSAVTGTEICFVKFRYHLSGNIVTAMDTQNLLLEGRKAQ